MEYVISDKFITFKHFAPFENRFVHCYTRGYDNSGASFDFTRRNEEDDLRVTRNIRLLSSLASFNPERLALVHQMHTDSVKKVTCKDTLQTVSFGELPVYDAMITDCKGVTLATKHADCVPIYFIDPVHDAVGLAHSGWKGTLHMIGPKTVAAMEQAYKSDPALLECVIGPSICKDCYEIQEDVYRLFTEQLPFTKRFISPKNSSYRLDLKGIIKETLIQTGLSRNKIHICEFCTCCNMHMMYSHRGSGGNCGRSLAVLGIRE